MIRRYGSLHRYAPNEVDILVTTAAVDIGGQPRGIVYCHGSGSSAEESAVEIRWLSDTLGRRSVLHMGDLGFQTWANDTAVDRIGQAIDSLRLIGVSGKVALVGASMGSGSALNYAYRYPEQVACVAACIPMTDIEFIRNNPNVAAPWVAEIDAIYGTPPDADYSGHSPILFADEIDPDLPIKIWYSDNDVLATPAKVMEFVAARPQTEVQSMGAINHMISEAFNWDITRWVDKHLVNRPPVVSPFSIVGERPRAQLLANDYTPVGQPSVPLSTGPIDVITTAKTLYVAYRAGAGPGFAALGEWSGSSGGTLLLERSASTGVQRAAVGIGYSAHNTVVANDTNHVMCASWNPGGNLLRFHDETGDTETGIPGVPEGFLGGTLQSYIDGAGRPLALLAYHGAHSKATRREIMTWLAGRYDAPPPA